MERLTLNDLIESEKDFFTVNDVCGVLGSDPQTIRVCARQRPELLGFRIIVMGNRVKIPRIQFLRYMGVEYPEILRGEKYEKSAGFMPPMR